MSEVWVTLIVVVIVIVAGVLLGLLMIRIQAWRDMKQFAERADKTFASSLRISLKQFEKEYGKTHVSFWRTK
jgi:hypothetical protein